MAWIGAVYAAASMMCAGLATLGAWKAHTAAAAVLREHLHDAHAYYAPCAAVNPSSGGTCIRPREHLDPMHESANGWTWN